MATIHYLNWDQEREEHGQATEFFHKLHFEEPPASLSADQFGELYREVIEVDAEPDGLEDVWREWQGTGFTEGSEFLELRYCERCSGYIEGVEESITHAVQNHGYDAVGGVPVYIRGERSMSVGDVVEIDGHYYIAASIGWEEIEVGPGS